MIKDCVVILGAGQAGGWAARTLRDEGYQGRIILVGAEPHAPYERPPLSKEILLGQSQPEALHILDDATLTALNIETKFGIEATAINRQAHTITLANGELLSYSKLVICTGGRARQLPLMDAGSKRVHTLRTIDDALRLKHSLETEPGEVLIIGGGWIGLEVAASAQQLQCTTTIVEFSSRLCQRSVAADMSDALLELHTREQGRVFLDTCVQSVTESDHALHIKLSNDQSLACTHLVVAAGLIANDEIAKAAGLICDNGIRVDQQCRTNDPDIYAAGDIAILQTVGSENWLRLESWQNAQDQGMAVARAILGQDITYQPTPLIWSQQFDQFIQIVGHVAGAETVARRMMANGGSIRFYQDVDQRIIGMIGINAGRDYRFARQLVERHGQIPPSELSDTQLSLKSLAERCALV
jgi:3-phenylpropionate/trans-cinnamate dioxygenase ferredoxin reductase subunit